MTNRPGWAPTTCTLPTVERPLREAEFDALFADALRALDRPAPTLLSLVLDPAAVDRTRDLTARESACCSFFVFTLTLGPSGLRLDLEVPPTSPCSTPSPTGPRRPDRDGAAPRLAGRHWPRAV